jgi:hypothetical protein
VNFDDAWARRIEAVIDPKSGQTAFIISKVDLIASKLAAGRMRDLADVEEIQAAESGSLSGSQAEQDKPENKY